MRPLILIVVASAILAGCVDALDAGTTPVPELDPIPEQPIVQDHDHTDASQHVGSANVDFVKWAPLIPEDLGREGFAGMRIVDDYAYIATDGEYAGFLIVDVSDPRNPELVSQYKTAGGASQEAVPSWDGNWVFLNLQRPVGPFDAAGDPERGTGLGIQIIDVSDKENPRFESFVPVESYGSHVMYYYEWDGKPHLVFNGQPTRHGIPTGQVYTQPVGNVVRITEFTEVGGTHTLVPVGEFRYVPGVHGTHSQGCFPHDMWVEAHPLTEREIMYVSHWDCGMVTVDVTDPSTPQYMDVWDDPAPSNMNRIHFSRPDPTLRGDRVIAYSAPEIDLSPGEAGLLRAYDVTDPADVTQIGSWEVPGAVQNDARFIFTPHNFDFDGDVLALAHYHAGVWIIDVSAPESPREVGYYLPHGEHGNPYQGEVWRKTPNFPEPYFPNVYEVKWYESPTDGETYLLVTERGSGLYVLRFTGDAS